ncbi:type 1 periplasmic-binding domain-containing protein [Streptomyces beihaiensis]|uniref:BMP family ABC transporter substrate-binding protein n=1 Tax=Streptomyces beihaiensis TaxID=2984495 RepID=A0ABT3TNQ2_9ACTN|nr:hypothetical protein [Streptomyces beihaiensis]MCX3058380.1 hypothetical protein [Streptomyces beihaiensis]
MNLPFSTHDHPRRTRLIAATAALATTGLLAWLAVTLPAGPKSPAFVANNISGNYRACLINSRRDEGVAQPVWSALQEATHGAPVNLQHTLVPKSGTAASLPYLNGLVQRHCGLIISVGPDLHTAVTTAARRNPHQRFIAIGRPVGLPNVRSYSPARRSAAVRAVREAAEQAHTSRRAVAHRVSS